MDVSDVSRPTPEGLEVDIMVSPRSGRYGLEGFDEWRKRLVVKVKAPPLDGKANKEVEDLMKDVTGCKSEIKSGHLNRMKTVMIYGNPEEIAESLKNGS
jgi:TIGR00251 family protein